MNSVGVLYQKLLQCCQN